MSDPFYTPDRRLPQREPRPAEPLWTLTRGVERIEGVLRDHGEGVGVEIQILRDGTFFYGRRFDTRALALSFAGLERVMLEAAGWRAD